MPAAIGHRQVDVEPVFHAGRVMVELPSLLPAPSFALYGARGAIAMQPSVLVAPTARPMPRPKPSSMVTMRASDHLLATGISRISSIRLTLPMTSAGVT